MAVDSKIEWTDATWNPVVGCTRVSAGCDHCYAVRQSFRNGEMGHAKYQGLTVLNPKGDRHFNGVVRTVAEALTIPLKRRKPTTYFVNSMSDLFHRDVPFEFIDRVFAVMAMCPQHTFQVLTKRTEWMAEYFAGMNTDLLGEDGSDVAGSDIAHRLSAAAGTLLDGTWIWGPGEPVRPRIDAFITDCFGELDGFDEDNPEREFKPIPWPLPNVWLGTSVEDQKNTRRVKDLLECPAAVRFISAEPLLGPLILKPYLTNDHTTRCPGSPAASLGCVDWVIVGGESGHGARPFNMQWARSIRDQCRAAGVAMFFKQAGLNAYDAPLGQEPPADGGWRIPFTGKGNDWTEWPEDLRVREFPTPSPRHSTTPSRTSPGVAS